MSTNTGFRQVFVVQPGFDYSALSSVTRHIIFLTVGTESIDEMSNIVRQRLDNFDPDLDAFVAVGKVNSVLICGIELSKKFNGKKIWLGSFKSRMVDEEMYEWHQIEL